MSIFLIKAFIRIHLEYIIVTFKNRVVCHNRSWVKKMIRKKNMSQAAKMYPFISKVLHVGKEALIWVKRLVFVLCW